MVIVNPDNGIDNFGLTLNATFADYEDGSERHFFFISKDYVSSVDTLPSGLNLVTDAKTILDFAGLNDNYIVLEVDSSHLIVNSGVADFTLNAHLYADKLPKWMAMSQLTSRLPHRTFRSVDTCEWRGDSTSWTG